VGNILHFESNGVPSVTVQIVAVLLNDRLVSLLALHLAARLVGLFALHLAPAALIVDLAEPDPADEGNVVVAPVLLLGRLLVSLAAAPLGVLMLLVGAEEIADEGMRCAVELTLPLVGISRVCSLMVGIVFVLLEIAALHAGIAEVGQHGALLLSEEARSVARMKVALVVLQPEEVHAQLPGLPVVMLLVDIYPVRWMVDGVAQKAEAAEESYLLLVGAALVLTCQVG